MCFFAYFQTVFFYLNLTKILIFRDSRTPSTPSQPPTSYSYENSSLLRPEAAAAGGQAAAAGGQAAGLATASTTLPRRQDEEANRQKES